MHVLRIAAILPCLGAVLAVPNAAMAAPAAAPAAASPAAGAGIGRVIVKFRRNGDLARNGGAERLQALRNRLAAAIEPGREIAGDRQVLMVRGLSSEQFAERLSALPDVEYAEPDRLRRALAAPNDPKYASQWYLQSAESSAARFADAWALGATGGNGIVVAVLDTGITRHPDLDGKVLPGYTFIADAALAGNEVGRAPGAADTGDYIDAADQKNPDLIAICGEANLAEQHVSSWHGTRVAGMIGAATDNGVGISGAAWAARILPARVLGKCGGFDSDIQAAMRWAAGLAVPGVPDNPYPARVLNLSLGAVSACPSSYREAIDEVTAAGAVVVAAAGNESGPVNSPGNCPGILAVAGLRHQGDKVGYSSFGAEVGISAPAGNCVNLGANEPCLFSLDTTINLGQREPTSAGYTNEYQYNVGTSFAVPLVAAAAALVLDVNPALKPAEAIAKLKTAARPFAKLAELADCPKSNSNGQCNCTTATCGAGMLDAAAAVRAALPAANPGIPASGLWSIDIENTGQSGRGFQLETRNGILVFTYYGYRTGGDSQWYLAAAPLDHGTFSGGLTQYRGGTFLGGSYRPATADGSVGTVGLNFSSPEHGQITLPGETPKAISKFSASGGGSPTIKPVGGFWVIGAEDTGESGRGFQIEEAGGLLIFTYYGYAGDSQELWYLASGPITGNSFRAALVQYRGGTVVGGKYQPAVAAAQAGEVAIVFTSSTTGVITLPGEGGKAIKKLTW